MTDEVKVRVRVGIQRPHHVLREDLHEIEACHDDGLKHKGHVNPSIYFL